MLLLSLFLLFLIFHFFQSPFLTDLYTDLYGGTIFLNLYEIELALLKYIFIVRSVGFVGFVGRKCMYRIYKYKNQSSDCNILLYLASTGLYAGKIFVPCYKIQFARLKYK